MNLNPFIKNSFLVALSLFTYSSYAQSISGKVVSIEHSKKLAYTTIDIYQGKKLVASVLADKEGNFDVKLDTGTYRAEIIYAGYKKVTKEIKISKDEKTDFSLALDESSKYADKKKEIKKHTHKDDVSDSYSTATHTESEIETYSDAVEEAEEASPVYGLTAIESRSHSRPRKSSPMMMKRSSPSLGVMRGDHRVSQPGEAGKLTAGEINDFSKWNLWTDLKEQELKTYKETWNISPEARYSVQVMDQRSLPLADVTVHLTSRDGKRIFSARTDNTGKAELWESLLFEQLSSKSKLSIEIPFNGKLYTIKRAKQFDKGINSITLQTDCNQSQKVDIAFVVDATGSMSDELNFLKAELNDVMFKSKSIGTSLNFSFANVFYRDHTDAYLTRKQDFTRVLSESVSFINDQQAGGGGDFEEAVEVALDTAINGLSWSPYARARIVFLILDAPPHNTPEIQEKLKKLSTKAAAQGIRIVPLVASGINKGTEYLMRSIALATNGTYAFLTDHSGIGNSHLKPSTDHFKVETLNDLLVRLIQSYTYMPDCDQQMPNLNLNYPSDSVSYTNADTTTVDTSVNNPTTNISWNYYPNPTRGIVNIKASVDIPELYITDLSGKVLRVVKEIKQKSTVQVDLSGYASGIYLIRYPVGTNWVSGKVVLVRE